MGQPIMENALRMAIIFVWSMFFGFFSVTAFIDETMAVERKTIILVGLLVGLGLYLAFEWWTSSRATAWEQKKGVEERTQESESHLEPQTHLDERVLRRLHLYTKDHEKDLQAAMKGDPPPKPKKHALSISKW